MPAFLPTAAGVPPVARVELAHWAPMSSGHKTSAVARPSRPAARVRPVSDHTRLQDFTSPIAPEHQLVTGRSNRWVLALVALAVLGALLAALFVLPVQAWLRQQDEIDTKRQELEVLTRANDELEAEVRHLGTEEGAREAAREELGVVATGEERISMLPPAGAALPLPAGWPYDAVSQIVAVRTAAPAAAATQP